MVIVKKVSSKIAEGLCRKITTNLPEYFGLEEASESCTIGIHSRTNLAAKIDCDYVGLISVDFPYPNNVNIYWMGILPDFHRQGFGKQLAEAAFKLEKINRAKTITVETLSPSESDDNYLKTYKFYQSLRFTPLFNLKPNSYRWNIVYMLKTLSED